MKPREKANIQMANFKLADCRKAYFRSANCYLANRQMVAPKFFVPPSTTISSHCKKKGMQPMATLSTG